MIRNTNIAFLYKVLGFSEVHEKNSRESTKILMILGPFLTIENFCLITEINTAPAGSSFQGHYEKGLQIYDLGHQPKSRGR